MGKIFAIAKITSNNSMIGLRIADVEQKKVQYKDVPIGSIKNVLLNGGIEIQNVAVVDGNLIGTNGSLDRLATIDIHKGLSGKSPLVVINRLGDAGYTVIDYKGVVKKATNTDVVKYAKLFGIANGKVIVKDNLEYISSITGEYETKEISASKLGGRKEVSIGLALNHDSRSVAKHVKAEAADEINNNDVFKSMTPAQKKVVQDYYMWYTVDIYENMSKGMRLSLKKTARGISKAETISQLRGEDDWTFGGIRDCGFLGASQCQLGHPLRYEYYAVAKDENGKVIDKIIFGETCSGDFFDISREDMAKLVKTRMMMTDEIKIITDIAANHTEKEEWGQIKLLVDTLRKLSGSRENSKEVYYEVFGSQVANTLANFINVNIPFPESLVLLAKKKIYEYGTVRFWGMIFEEHQDTIASILDNPSYYSLRGVAGLYLQFMVQVQMAGKFGYDPTKYKLDREKSTYKNMKLGKNDEIGKRFRYTNDKPGGFSKKDAETRELLLSRMRMYLKCKDYSLDEAEEVIKVIGEYDKDVEIAKGWAKLALEKYDIYLRDKLREVEVDNEMYDVAYMLLASEGRIVLDRSYATRQKYRDYNTIQVDALLARVGTKEFEDSMNGLLAETAEEKRIKDEKEALEKERIEKEMQERIEREQKEKEEKEKAIADEHKGSIESKDSNILDELKELITRCPNVKGDYATNIAQDIIRRGTDYDKLSYKQKNIIEKAYATYKEASGGEVPAGEINATHTLEEKPQIKEEVDLILSYKDNKDIADKIRTVLPKVFDIAESVKKRGKVSDRQYKHIKAAYNIITIMTE